MNENLQKFGWKHQIQQDARGSSHATLRMAFQIPFEVSTGPENVIELTAETPETNFNTETIKREILNKLDLGCRGPSPNIVILEPGSNPNSDDEILHVAPRTFVQY